MKLKTIRLLAAATSMATALVLAGCSNILTSPNNPTPQTSASATPAAVHTGEFKIPSNFPSDIPIRSGEVVLASVAGDEPNFTWAIEVIVDDLDVARTETLAELADAGFELQQESGVGTSTYLATLTRADFIVLLKVYFEEETGELEVRYVVTPNNG